MGPPRCPANHHWTTDWTTDRFFSRGRTGRTRESAKFPKKFGAPGVSRTRDPLLRRQMLYPTELRAQPMQLPSEQVLRMNAPPGQVVSPPACNRSVTA